MTHRSNLTLAALASATMPGIAVSGTRSSNQASAGDIEAGIDLAIIQDGPGRLLDVAASSTDDGKARLLRRVNSANTLAQAKEPGGLGFAMERVVAYQPGDSPNGPTGTTSVAVFAHCAGSSVALHALDTQDCIAIGTAIGAIHRLRGAFLQEASYPVFTTENIKQQLLSWIARLSKAGHIPEEIIRSWSDIVNTSGLWSFTTCPVHGGFDDGDFLFSDTTLTAIYNWQDMQINDPARDLAWMFAKLDEARRNALIAAYGRMMGSHLDPMIMLRANLWLQMEQVGEFISALDHADNDRILQFKAQVEHLAHQLVARQSAKQRLDDTNRNRHAPSTITVGTLLDDPSRVSNRSGTHAATQAAHHPQPADGHAEAGISGRTAEPAPSPSQPASDNSPAIGEKGNRPEPPRAQPHVDEVEDVSSATIVVSAVSMHTASSAAPGHETDSSSKHTPAMREVAADQALHGNADGLSEHVLHTDDPAPASIPIPAEVSTSAPVSTSVPVSTPESIPTPVSPTPAPSSTPLPSSTHLSASTSAEDFSVNDAAETMMIPHLGSAQNHETRTAYVPQRDHTAENGRHDDAPSSDADGEQSNPGE